MMNKLKLINVVFLVYCDLYKVFLYKKINISIIFKNGDV